MPALTSRPARRRRTRFLLPTGSSDRPTAEAFDKRPNAELIGLRNLGIVVEDLSGAGDRVRAEP